MKNVRERLRRATFFVIGGLFFQACGANTLSNDPVSTPQTPNTYPYPYNSGAYSPVGVPSNVTTPPGTAYTPYSTYAPPMVNGVQVLPQGQAGQMMLPIGAIYNQGMSGWCWAFSAFHALRTYYYDSPSSDPNTLAWRQALASIDSLSGLKGYLASGFGTLIGGLVGGDPENFISHFQKVKGLPPQNWQSIDVDDRIALTNQIANNIRNFIPSIFCTVDHCRMIYGFVSDGMQITHFAFADSSATPPGTYLQDVTSSGKWGADEVVTFVP